jgi:hypothetical protein
VHRVLAELGLEDEVLLWNVVPTHPHEPGRPSTNRSPTSAEVGASAVFLEELSHSRRVIAVGRLAQAVTGAPYVRHPGHGGARAFRFDLSRLLAKGPGRKRVAATISPRRTPVRPFFVSMQDL